VFFSFGTLYKPKKIRRLLPERAANRRFSWLITSGKTELAKLAKQLNLDAIHDTVHEMARDEARHGKAFAGLLERYFGK